MKKTVKGKIVDIDEDAIWENFKRYPKIRIALLIEPTECPPGYGHEIEVSWEEPVTWHQCPCCDWVAPE